MPFESFMRNEFIPIRNEFILDRNYGKLLRKAPEWIHSRLEYIHSGSGFFIVRGTFFYSLTLGWLLWTVHTETPVPLCVHTAQLPDRGHVALTHAALGWEGQLAPLLWLPRPGAAAGPRAAPPGGRLQAGLGPGLLWVRSGFSPLRGDAAQPPLHHPGRLAHTPAYLHMCTNILQSFVDIFTKYYLWSTHFLCSRGSQDCVTWHGGVYCDSRQPRPATPVFWTIFHNFYLEAAAWKLKIMLPDPFFT